MKSNFVERTLYRLMRLPAPSCFLRLDDHFDLALPMQPARGAATHLPVLLAERLCARFAEVEWYADSILDARKREGLDREADVKAALLTRAWFVGYLGAARAFLDAAAATLDSVYDLRLARADCTFASSFFWQTLVEQSPNTHRRYHTNRIFFNEVFRWCAESADRVAPLEVIYATFGPYSTRDAHLRVLDEAEMLYATLAQGRRTLNWIDPLSLHDRWKAHLLSLSERLCDEIRQTVPLHE